MKRLLALTLIVSFFGAYTALAASSVTQAVFSITSSAKTSAFNLRVVPMTPRTIAKDDNTKDLQTFVWKAKAAQNLFLTKSTTVSLSDTLCAWVQVDQDTKIAVNSEAAYMILTSGTDKIVCFK